MIKTHRHELKYYINQGETLLLASRLRLVMDRDKNSDENGEYAIRSLYFDDISNTAVTQKLSGEYERKKYRIRIYNCSDKLIKLERKEKSGSAICKTSMTISREQCDALISGNPSFLLGYKNSLAQDMFYQMRNRRLKPVIVVDYAREAFIHPFQDVRITLDKRMSSGSSGFNIFDPQLPLISAMTDFDTILEVKFNEHLPAYFHSLIQMSSSQRSAVSKYILCRNFY